MRLKALLGPLPNVGASALVTTLGLLFFIGLCCYVYRRERKNIYKHLEMLPLEEDF